MRFLTVVTSIALCASTLAAKKLTLNDLPAPVQKTVQAELKGAEIKNIGKETENGVTQYEVETMLNGKHRDFNVDTKGNLLVTEEETTIDAIPAAAKAAIVKKIADGKLGTIEILTRNGATMYEAAYTTKAGKKQEFVYNTLGTQGSNPYFNLTPGYRLRYQDGGDVDTLTVLNETKRIDGVETRVVEDREEKNGALVELTRDYYAIDSVTNDVFYFGEDVDVYKNGKVVSHEGAWLSGVKGAKFGLMMPAAPKSGQKFYQEHAPGAGMDHAEIVALDEKVTTPAGTFDHCVHVVEDGKDHKWYARGPGLVKDGKLVLVEYTK